MKRVDGKPKLKAALTLPEFILSLEEFYTIDPVTGCHNWNGALFQHKGYPRIWMQIDGITKTYKPQRVLYEAIHRTKLARFDFLCHKCDNPKCINIDHIFLGSPGDNSRDMVNKGRSLKGSKNPDATLTESQVIELLEFKRANPKISQTKLGKRFNIDQTTVSSILLGKTWVHVTNITRPAR